jgi:sec-independent protein translocase protein TatC
MKKRRGETSSAQTMLDHVRELQVRLLVTAGVLLVGAVIGYLLFDPILAWLRAPLGQTLYYTTPTGSFGFVMKIAFMVGLVITLPTLIYHLVMFVRPAIKGGLSKKRVYALTGASMLLAASGAMFGFYLIMPGALHFFGGFQVSGLSALISADSYLGFVTNVLITFMVVFQIPLLLIIADRVKPLPPKKLLKMEKYVVIGGLVISLLVPFAMDLTTSLLIAAPIILLYNIAIIGVVIQHLAARRKARLAQVTNTVLAEDMMVSDEILAELAESVQLAVTRPLVTIRPQVEEVQPDIRRAGSKEAMIQAAREQREQQRQQLLEERLAQFEQLPKPKYRQISGIQ